MVIIPHDLKGFTKSADREVYGQSDTWGGEIYDGANIWHAKCEDTTSVCGGVVNNYNNSNNNNNNNNNNNSPINQIANRNNAFLQDPYLPMFVL